jgi:chromosome segregation ATPase
VQKLELERERMRMEREDREADRKAQSEEKERDRNHEADKVGFKRKESSDKELTSVLSGFAKAFKQIDTKLDRLDAKIDDVAEDAKAPVSVERGKDGRIASVTKGKRRMTIERDAKGRVGAIT